MYHRYGVWSRQIERLHFYAKAARSTAEKGKLPHERGAVASCLNSQLSVARRGVKFTWFVRILCLDPRFITFGLSRVFHHVMRKQGIILTRKNRYLIISKTHCCASYCSRCSDYATGCVVRGLIPVSIRAFLLSKISKLPERETDHSP